MDGAAEFVDAGAALAGGFDNRFDVGIFVPQGFAVEIQGLFVAFVADDDDGGGVAEAFDQFQPVFEAVFVFAGATVGDEEVEAAFGEEKLVGGVVDFLSAEVPDVEFDGFGVDCNFPVCDVESVGLGLVGVVLVVGEAVDEGGFADATLADEEDFGFVEGEDFAAAELAEVVEDGGGSTGSLHNVGRVLELLEKWAGGLRRRSSISSFGSVSKHSGIFSI